MKRTSRKPKRTSRNPGIDTKLYSVIDRMTGFERRHLTKEQAKLTLDAHEDRCSRHGWRSEARVYYRDGADVTREFRGGGMDRNPRLTEAQRSRLPLSVFVFPERRAFPLESKTAAYDAIRMLRLGRVKGASDFKAVTDAIRAKYPAVWKKYGAGLSWPKTKAAKALGSKHRAATVAKKKRTSRMAANAGSSKVPVAVEKAVNAVRLYHGASGCRVRDQQKLYTRMRRALDAVTQKYGEDAEQQILREATRRGAILPIPGKDI